MCHFYHAIGNPISLGMIGFLLGTYISLQTNVCHLPQKRTIDTFGAGICFFSFETVNLTVLVVKH